MVRRYIVYSIVNSRTGKSYFGRTKSFEMRKRSHLNSLISNSHHVKEMQKDYNNRDKFRFLKLKECNCKFSASIIEQALISDYKCYNKSGSLISLWSFVLLFKYDVISVNKLAKISKQYGEKIKRRQAYRGRAQKNNR